jgi:NitT/TauT family transport system substrate-binding protein
MRINCLSLIALALLVGCSPSAPNPPATVGGGVGAETEIRQLVAVKLALNWYPEAEHGGFYAALRQGYYREVGLEVEIVKGGPNAPVIPLVARGNMAFGVANADGLLLGRGQNAPVVALMAPLQTSPRSIMVHESSGIEDFEDLKKLRTLAVSDSQPFFRFLTKRVSLEGVTIVPYQGNVAMFLVKSDFGQQAYIFSEPFTAKQEGGDPKSLLVADLGFNPYTSVLFTSEPFLLDHGDVVRGMVAASVRGWELYLAQPEETNRYIHEINPEMSLEALAYGVDALAPLVRNKEADAVGIGHMSAQRWQTLADQLVEIGSLAAGSVRPDEAFTTKFLSE